MLSILEGRVLGCLLEKERTTPDQYPLSLNSLVSACNQSTAREPVMVVSPHDAQAAIVSMKTQGLVRLVHPSHGKSVTRYRQVADERDNWTRGQTAIIAVLLLRGPQTAAELRARTERIHDFGLPDGVEAVLRELASVDAAVVVQLERATGQKELRWQQLLAEEAEIAPRAVARSTSDGLDDRVVELEAKVARLEAALADLL